MPEIPPPLHTITARIDAAHEQRQEPPRPHLGCSIAGHHCERWIWLSFRWASIERFPGRVLRLFRRGQNEEVTIAEDLRLAGIYVTDDQKRVSWGGHVSGSIDGIATGVTKRPHLVEMKTHSLKSFKDLVKQGVQKSKPQHYGQMQLYMLGLGLERALYVSICKDDDTYYTERVHFDEEYAKKLLQKVTRLSLQNEMPPPISTDPSWYQCKFCPAHDFCHKSKLTKEVNCRTCAHSTPREDGTWHCEVWKDTIPVEAQRTGCDAHVLHPDMVPWRLLPDQSTDTVAAYEVDGKVVLNGQDNILSRELVANASACTDEQVLKIREDFEGEIKG